MPLSRVTLCYFTRGQPAGLLRMYLGPSGLGAKQNVPGLRVALRAVSAKWLGQSRKDGGFLLSDWL